MTHSALRQLPRGWFHHGAQVLALLEQHRPAVIVELGTHMGQSAIAMARVASAWGGVIYCVDTWAGVPKPGRVIQPVKLFECGLHLWRAQIGARVRLIPATTAAAARVWPGPAIDCLYVDADHSYAGCLADLTAWWPHVRAGGLILGDDYDHPKYPGVNQAWDAFEQSHGLSLQRVASAETDPPGMRLVYGVKS